MTSDYQETTDIERDILYELNNGTESFSELNKKLKSRPKASIWFCLESLQKEGILKIEKDLQDRRSNKISIIKDKVIIKKAWRDYSSDLVILASIFAFCLVISLYIEQMFLFFGASIAVIIMLSSYLIRVIKDRKHTKILKKPTI